VFLFFAALLFGDLSGVGLFGFGLAAFGLFGGLPGLFGAACELGFEFGSEGFGFGDFLLGGAAGLGFGGLAGLPVGF